MPQPSPRFQWRRAAAADIPAMSALRLAVKENMLSDPARITPQMYLDHLDAQGRSWVCLLDDGRLVGFSSAARADGSIWALFVAPEFEGLGAGKALLGLATDWLFALGHERVILGTGIATRADRFYLAQGWTRGALAPGGLEVGYTLKRPDAMA